MVDVPTTDSRLRILSEPVRRSLLPLMERALDACVERHQVAEDRGADGFSFGTDAWSLPARLFRDSFGEEGGEFSISPAPGLELLYDGIKVRHHRVGESDSDDIWNSFPQDAKKAATEASRQLSLELEGLDTNRSTESVVLAYMANPIEGLCAAYLCTVSEVSKGKITGWSQVVEIWRREADGTAQLRGSSRPPPEVPPSPIVERRPGTIVKNE